MFEKALQPPGLCPKCGQNTLYHNKTGLNGAGLGKNGQPYENYKCSKRECGYIEWVKQSTPKPLGQKTVQAQGDPMRIISEALGILPGMAKDLKDIKAILNSNGMTDEGVDPESIFGGER